MAEFCPRCTAPLETSRDADRLCEVCGWFGDQQEALLMPPRSDVLNPVLAAAQTLELYRDVCRKELDRRADLRRRQRAPRPTCNGSTWPGGTPPTRSSKCSSRCGTGP